MAITPQQVQAAEALQNAAARDIAPQVRLIAGPGTGKSSAIQERVRWLLTSGVQPGGIFVVSFTRASARDLRTRIIDYCTRQGPQNSDLVSVTTLHSLALRSLRAAGLLVYPADPLILDDWELEHLHDQEYSCSTGFRQGRAGPGSSPTRAKDIRLQYEAFCGTGQWQPPGYIAPNPHVTQQERQNYGLYHRARTQLYSYVLPGEIVHQCVDNMHAGVLNPAQLLNITHLIVDEYQDLNPSDLEFVDILIRSGVNIFVAGDDDQSLYSFRYASPQGIQSFSQRHRNVSDHHLSDCFRSTPNVLAPAIDLIQTFADPTRIPKHLSSLYGNANPPEAGMAYRWRFRSGVSEARSIAESCRDLIAIGIPAREIMILISNTRVNLPTLRRALTDAGVLFEAPRSDTFFDTRVARFAFALIRIACDPYDYVAHRLIFGLAPRVGIATCDLLAQSAITSGLNYRELFYNPVPNGVFQRREANALQNARQICRTVSQWLPDDTIAVRGTSIDQIIRPLYGSIEADQFAAVLQTLPPDSTLTETRDYLWADTDEQRANIVQAIYQRLAIAPPPSGFLPAQVRIMTMHGAKGLSAKVVFIPALEESILPGPRRQPFPGLVFEAARMLYVSITRARAACIMSFSTTRYMYGSVSRQVPSRFLTNLSGPFLDRNNGLNQAEVQQIQGSIANLN